MAKHTLVLSGHFPGSQFYSHINHALYCHYHGYTYIHANWPTNQKNLYFNKVEYIKYYIKKFKYVFWIDHDAFFINYEKSLDEFYPTQKKFMTICAGPFLNQIFTRISSGQFMLKNTHGSSKLLDDWRDNLLQDSMSDWTKNDGFFTNGDQDVLWHLIKKEYKNSVFIMPQSKFNSRIEDILVSPNDVFLLHLTGSARIKRKKLNQAIRLLDRDKALVPKSISKKFGLENNFYDTPIGREKIRYYFDKILRKI